MKYLRHKMKRYFLVLFAIFLVDIHMSYSAAEEGLKAVILRPVKPQYFQNRPIIVLEVIEDSPAAVAGLEVGDLVVEVNKKKVLTKSQFVEVLSEEKSRGNVSFSILREGVSKILTAEFEDPTQKLGIDIGDYFVIAQKRAHLPTMSQRKANFGIGINGVETPQGIVKFNIRVDNFSENDTKIGSDSIVVTANGMKLHRLSPEDVIDMIYPKAKRLEDTISLGRRPLSKKEQKLLSKRRRELKMLGQLDLKDSSIPHKGFVIGSLFYNNRFQAYPVALEIRVGDQVFNFTFDKEAE